MHDCISRIPVSATENEPNPYFQRRGERYDPRTTQLRGLITCGGGESNHWSGRRWTVRELATLQTFPTKFQFSTDATRGDKLRQIGNAFAPAHAAAVFRECIRTLQAVDGRPERENVSTSIRANTPVTLQYRREDNTPSYNKSPASRNIPVIALDD